MQLSNTRLPHFHVSGRFLERELNWRFQGIASTYVHMLHAVDPSHVLAIQWVPDEWPCILTGALPRAFSAFKMVARRRPKQTADHVSPKRIGRFDWLNMGTGSRLANFMITCSAVCQDLLDLVSGWGASLMFTMYLIAVVLVLKLNQMGVLICANTLGRHYASN